MLKVFEIKETLENTLLIDNLYKINKITKELINKTDFDYINIVLQKTRNNLEKVNKIIKY